MAALQQGREAFLVKAVTACKDAHGRTVLRLLREQDPPVKDLEAVLASGKSQHRRCVARALDGRKDANLEFTTAPVTRPPMWWSAST